MSTAPGENFLRGVRWQELPAVQALADISHTGPAERSFWNTVCLFRRIRRAPIAQNGCWRRPWECYESRLSLLPFNAKGVGGGADLFWEKRPSFGIVTKIIVSPQKIRFPSRSLLLGLGAKKKSSLWWLSSGCRTQSNLGLGTSNVPCKRP